MTHTFAYDSLGRATRTERPDGSGSDTAYDGLLVAVSERGVDDATGVEKTLERNVFGNLTPAQKANIIESLRQQGEYVAMVGNNISDIPAMRQAQVSVALRSGDPAAMNSGIGAA